MFATVSSGNHGQGLTGPVIFSEPPTHVVIPKRYNNPFVVDGQETVMVELVDQVGDLDIALGPVIRGGAPSSICLATQTTPTTHGQLCL